MTQIQSKNDYLLQAKLDNAKVLYNLAKSVNFKEVNYSIEKFKKNKKESYFNGFRQQLYVFWKMVLKSVVKIQNALKASHLFILVYFKSIMLKKIVFVFVLI